EAAFRDLAGKVQAHDVFILYLAGHGMTLDGEFHFIPADVIYENAWQGAPFAHLQALPTDARPVTDWADRDQAFTNVAQGIRRAAQAIRHTATDAPIAHTLLAAPSDAHRRQLSRVFGGLGVLVFLVAAAVGWYAYDQQATRLARHLDDGRRFLATG